MTNEQTKRYCLFLCSIIFLMKIISWNVNGLRSIYGANFLEWLRCEQPDIVCLQEIKIQEHQLAFDMLRPLGYQVYFSFAGKKGYSGVAVYSRMPIVDTINRMGFQRFDSEGRFLLVRCRDLILVNVYMPLGRPLEKNMPYKMQAFDKLLDFLKGKKNVVLVGDFNVAHTENDLARPDRNRGSVKFTEPERARIDELLALGFVDTFREVHPEENKYSYWRYKGNKDECGWRIDYCFVTENLSKRVKDAFVQENIEGSDHKPVGVILGGK